MNLVLEKPAMFGNMTLKGVSMPSFIDLTGRIFGRLQVIKRVENDRQGKAKWLCKCGCGKETVSTRNDLRNGDKKSCGCLRKEILSKDITNKRYGKLIALKPVGKSTSTIWNCKCDCGNIHNVTVNHLEMNQVKSCGCVNNKTEKQLFDEAKKRFFENIEKNDCWIWKGNVSRNYGVLFFKKNVRAHRFSYLIHNGKLKKGYLVCHHCDNPLCVNPEHLYLGTSKDNHNDMIKRGRFRPRGKTTPKMLDVR